MKRRWPAIVAIAGTVVLSVACASTSRKVVRTVPEDSLETYIRKVRQLSVAAKQREAGAPHIESQTGELRAAIEALTAEPSGANMRRVGAAYFSSGILDAAYDHYAAAVWRDRRDAAAYDALARIWREWGFPELGLGDARRALFYAPESASAHNTFGTLLIAVGNVPEARLAFGRALALDDSAAYAWTNLCYASALVGEGARAVAECRRALTLDPASATARNDLGLAYVVSGDFAAAAREFGATAGEVAGAFNMGIAFAAQGRYADAAEAFETAGKLRPAWAEAGDRARQARRRLAVERSPEK